MQQPNFEETLETIVAGDPRFTADAYHFIREALDQTQKLAAKNAKGTSRHVSGQELLDGIRGHALRLYGPMVPTVFEDWGVRSCEDFGEIVFNLVESKILAKTDTDSRVDFQGGYEFEDAFRKPYLPASGRQANHIIQESKTPA
jgi:uncharacterized repeat protein (TIGR04138 family)